MARNTGRGSQASQQPMTARQQAAANWAATDWTRRNTETGQLVNSGYRDTEKQKEIYERYGLRLMGPPEVWLVSPIYIAGPMSGIPEYNAPAFLRAEAFVRSKYPFFEIRNPASWGVPPSEIRDGSSRYGFYFREALRKLVDCNSAVFLDGWQASKGAHTEYIIACRMYIPRAFLKTTDTGLVLEHAELEL